MSQRYRIPLALLSQAERTLPINVGDHDSIV